MVKLFIDTGKLSIKKKLLLKKLVHFELIIFDLDNTIYPMIYYDYLNFKNIANYVVQQKFFKKKTITDYLLKKKYFEKSSEKLFNIFIKEFNLKNIIKEKKILNLYQNFKVRKKFKCPNLLNIINQLNKYNRKIMIITEGHFNRQNNKIKMLKLNKIIDYKIILDGKKNKHYKPSIKGVSKYLKLIKSKKTVYIGDSDKDRVMSKYLSSKFYFFDISKFVKFKNL